MNGHRQSAGPAGPRLYVFASKIAELVCKSAKIWEFGGDRKFPEGYRILPVLVRGGSSD